MSKAVLGITIGAVLGALDGLSAWFSPEARPMLLTIVTASTAKGVVTGLLAGLVANRWRSIAIGVGAGMLIGFALSTLAAMGQGDHYLEIILPGMLVGALVGFATQRFPEIASSRGSRAMMGTLMAAAVCATMSASGEQAPPATDPLAPLAPLIGRWTGTSEGQPGKGAVDREYERILGSRFIQVRNRSTYPAQEKNPKGEVHEDVGVFSFDRARKSIVLRQFHVEGFVNQYVLDASSSATRIVFTTEAIVNIPSGWRARETYVLELPDRLEEVFELAEPGKNFDVYSRTTLTRTR